MELPIYVCVYCKQPTFPCQCPQAVARRAGVEHGVRAERERVVAWLRAGRPGAQTAWDVCDIIDFTADAIEAGKHAAPAPPAQEPTRERLTVTLCMGGMHHLWAGDVCARCNEPRPLPPAPEEGR